MQCWFVEIVRISLRVFMSNVHVTVFSVFPSFLSFSSLLFIQKKIRFNPVFSQKKWEGSKADPWNKSLRFVEQGDWDVLLHRQTKSHVALGRDILTENQVRERNEFWSWLDKKTGKFNLRLQWCHGCRGFRIVLSAVK